MSEPHDPRIEGLLRALSILFKVEISELRAIVNEDGLATTDTQTVASDEPVARAGVSS